MSRYVMEQVNGVKLSVFPLHELNKVADLIYFDGPLLSWFKDDSDHDFLYYWVDSDGEYNRWLVFRTLNEKIEKYIKHKTTLFDLLIDPADGFIYSVDIVGSNELIYENIHIVTPEILPWTYLPSIDSYYDYEPLFIRRNAELSSGNYAIQIDREWSLDDLHGLPQTYSQVYSFLYSLEASKGGRAVMQKEKEVFAHYPWRGGFSAVNFYNDLQSLIPSQHTPRVVRLQYSSPGVIELQLFTPISNSIRDSIQAYLGSAGEIDELYNFIMRFQKKYNFLRKKIEEDQIATEVMEMIVQQTKDFSTMLKYEYVDATNKLTNNRLLTLRIILSYFRRVKVLAKYQIEGRATY